MKAKPSRPINLLSAFRRQLLGMAIVASLVSAVVLGCEEATPAAGTTPTQTKEQVVAATTPPAAVPTKPPVPTATPTPVAPTPEQLIAETTRATYAAQTLTFDMDMDMRMSVTGGRKPMTVSMAMDGTGSANMPNKEMQLHMNMHTQIPELGTQTITMQMYMVGGYAYVRTAVPGAGDQWMKMKSTDQMWQDQVQIDQQVALMNTAANLRIVGTESIGGIQAYVVEIMPDMPAMFNLLGQNQVPGLEDLDLRELDTVAALFKDVTVKYWISRDTNLLLKVEMHMAGEIPSDALQTATADFDKMLMDITMKGTYTYDQPVSITLPQAAQGALELPSTYGR